jgi:hypothetical protein
MSFVLPSSASVAFGGYLRLVMPPDYNVTLRTSTVKCTLTSSANTVVQYGGACRIQGVAFRLLLQQTLSAGIYTLTVSVNQPLFFHQLHNQPYL